MRFGVLGETAVRTEDGRVVRVPELKVRALLASLLVDPGRPVATHRLVDDLWGEEPPGNPVRALQAKVSQLRRVLEEAEAGGRELVVSRAPGYQLVVREGALDADRFTALAARARAVAEPGRRAALFAEALELWRGPAFADFADEPFARAAVNRLEEERLVVREEAAEARLAAGEHALLVGELAELVEAHPLRERLRAAHLRALYGSGRQGEALAGYDSLRTRLAEDLGLDPSPELAALQRAMLVQDPALGAPGAGAGAGPTAPAARPSMADPWPAAGRGALSAAAPNSAPQPAASGPEPWPAAGPGAGGLSASGGESWPAAGQGVASGRDAAVLDRRGNLPVPVVGLVGRDADVGEVCGLLGGRRLVTLCGPGGVGKTRLAVQVARRVRGRFPDGAWLVELAGARGELAEVVAAALELRDDGAWGLHPDGPRGGARVEVWRTGLTVMSGDGTDRQRRIEAALAAHDTASGPAPWPRWFLAHALCGTGGQGEGAALTGEALDGFRAHGDPWGEAAARADRSVQRLLRGDLAGADADAAASAELFGRLGDACGGLWSVYPLATVAEVHGAYERAARLKRAGLETAERFGLTTEVPDLLSGLGRTALLMGDLAQARAYHQAGREKAAEVGFRAGEINAVLGLGLGARREGLWEEAEGHLREVLEWHRLVGLDGANALILAELGFVAELRGDGAGALALHREGYVTALTTVDPRAVALALEGLAGAVALAGRESGAAVLLGAAGALRGSTGAPLPAAERLDVDRVASAARALLGEEVFEAALARGAGLGPEAAVREACGSLGEPVP
ncbi:BTAD domain-containing putative transcriptional regulator [Streptomyces sp. P9(2023)]|nr:BTAD domain-containing putative transcriptional regulator [Streptomyces sp. P9(2023)]MDT9691484.1 BTAD domain-containing putative transcriptional regulator [Streptomyces sp. P9(2023)]